MTQAATKPRQPVDFQNRIAALDPTRSICVTAPAGSGKTELLSQRVLKLLSRVNQPEEILAITFTRKAAGEMHHRIMNALRAAAQEPEPEEPHKQLSWHLARDALAQDREKGWRLLENPGRLQIQTIDSLCASLTRQMPVLSNFGAQPQVTDNAGVYYRQAIRQLLEYLESDTAIAEAIARLLIHVDNDFARVERLLVDMLQRRDQWLLHIGTGGNLLQARSRLEATLETIIVDVLRRLNTQLMPLAPELLPLFDYAGSNACLLHLESPIKHLAGCTDFPALSPQALPQWRGIAELLVTKSKTPAFRKRLDKNCGFPTETPEGDKKRAKQRKQAMTEQLALLSENGRLLSALTEFQSLPDCRYADAQWQLLEALLNVLPVLVAELALTFQQEGTVDFTQIAMAALQSLGDHLNPSELALRLDYRLRHILIDEFQDTSSTQFRLLERLTDGWAEHNAQDLDAPNTLFLVGDGMQSIYGFREANVGLFLEARRFGVNGIRLDDLPLTVNFRSVNNVVEWNNRVFATAFPPEENLARGAVPYEQAVAFAGDSEQGRVGIHGFIGDQAPEDEARHLAGLIETTLQQYPDNNIGVLVRSRGHLVALVAELGKRRIPWNATEIDSLNSYACIIDLLSLTRAMSNLADRISWAALLRTPWFGFSNSDLYYLLSDAATECPWSQLQNWQAARHQLSGFAAERLRLQLPKINRALETRQRYSFREWLEGLWLALGGAAAVNDPRELDMVDSFFDLVETHQQAGGIDSLVEFEEQVTRLYARPQHPDSPVHLMTIHKSKGLEFDTVILPALSRKPRSDDKALLLWREYIAAEGGETGLVVSPLPAAGSTDRVYDHLRYEQGQSQALENARLLYVAATRAIKRLYLSFTTTLNEKTQQPSPPAANSLLATIWQQVEGEVTWHTPAAEPAAQLGLDLDAAPSQSLLKRLDAGWQAPSWSFPNPLASYYLNADFAGENIPSTEEDRVATTVGTVVHKVLEILHLHSIEFWQGMALRERRCWIEALLVSSGMVDRGVLEAAVSQVLAAVENTVKDDMGRWLLTMAQHTDHTELALSSMEGDRIRHRVVDRILRDDQGGLWVVDYKTNRPAQGETRAGFVRRCCAEYREQLLDYQWHVGRALREDGPIRMALYFTALPMFKEIE